MYRTPARRALSPDSPVRYRDSRRSRSRGHSPARRGRSPDRRARSRSRQGRRSRSRGRTARSRSRPRRSPPSPYRRRSRSPPSPYRRRSPGDERRHERRRSPGSRSSPAGDHRPAEHRPLGSPPNQDRSSDVKPSGNDASLRSCSGDLPATSLPMPKKSILKKRPDVESSSCDQSPQVDIFLSSKDERSVNSMGAAEKNNLTTESPLSMVLKMGFLTSSSSKASSLAAAAQSPEAPLPHGSKTPPCDAMDSSKVTPFSSTRGNLFTKSSSKSQTSPFSGRNVFPKQKAAIEADSFFLPHEQDHKTSPLLSKTSDIKQWSSTEIEDEERFLYGDEEEKKPEQKQALSDQPASAPPVKSSVNKQEFEKIHDLLKTIGLDIGVAEIGKLAVRTQERLHGKKVAPKMTQPADEQQQTGPTAISAEPKAKVPKPKTQIFEPKAKVPDPQVKSERKEAEPAVKTELLIKPVPKEPAPPVMQPSPAPIPKEKPQLIFRTPLPKETIAAPKVEVPVQPPIPCPVPEPTLSPISPSQIPVYPQSPYSPMVPAYSMPPSYNPYTPYVSYPTSSWTMYSPLPPQPPPPHMPPPPPHMPPPPPISVPLSAPAAVYNPRSNLRVIETTADFTDVKATVKTDAKLTTSLAALLAKQDADRKNKEAEKLKVLEELDSVRKEHKAKSGNLKTLSTKVEQLRIQQGILLRKKRREKDGHKDPLLEELNNVLESAQKQINSLSEEINTTKQKQQQLTKVAEILGVSPAELVEKSDPKKEDSPGSPALTRAFDNGSRTNSDSSKSSNDLKSRSDQVSDAKTKSSSVAGADAKLLGATHLSTVTEKSEVKCKGPPPMPSPDPKKSPEPHSPYISKSRDKSGSKSPQPTSPSSKRADQPENPLPFDLSEIFEYYDSGSHWCEDCNEICMTLHEFLLHLHDKKHKQSVKVVKKPWVKKKTQELSPTKKQKVNVPLKGAEFLVPVNGHYCELCDETFPDHAAAAEHLKAFAHNEKYKKHTDVHFNYEVKRREKKKASLTAAQEMDQRITEHKRKIAEQKFEVKDYSKSKKAKKEEAKKAKSKHRTSASPPSSNQTRNKTPEKEFAKFGKFVWKTGEHKTQAAAISSKVEAAPIKPKEEDPKTLSLKPKSFVIKLMGKPSALSGNALSPSHSSASTTVTSTTSSTSTSTAQPKVRPNLPGLANVRLPTPQVTMSKPAPLNTFLSIKSSNATSKSIPIMKNKPTGVFPEDSKAYSGKLAIPKESPQPESKDKTPNRDPKTIGQSTKPVQATKGQDLLNVLNKKETEEKQVVKNERESLVSKLPSSWLSQKSKPVPGRTLYTNLFGPIKHTVNTGTAKVQNVPNTKFGTNPAPSSVSSTTSAMSSLNNSSSNLSNKSEGTISQTKPQADKPQPMRSMEEDTVQKPKDATPSKSGKETPQVVKEYLPAQQAKPKDINIQNLQETKPLPTAVTINRDKPVSTPMLPMQNAKPTFNATTKLNQKFKKAPLSLPSSLFGYVQDAGCKDIKITSIEAQKSNNSRDQTGRPLIPPAEKVASNLPTTHSPDNPSPMQHELASYYTLIASEDDPEDLTTSEDQESEVAHEPTHSSRIAVQTKVETSPEKNVKLERAHALEKTLIKPVVPEVSGEDFDDSDMACEVPDATLSSVSQTSACNLMQSSYPSSNSHQPSNLASGKVSMNKDQSKETQVATMAALDNSMEDLSVYVTCDSD